MPIFNSLGSNYKLREALTAVKQNFNPQQKKQLTTVKEQLEKFFQGEVVFLFNGRDAIEYCLTAYGISQDDQVLTQAFSCSSIEEAINRVKAEAIYFDLAPGKISTTVKQVKQAYNQAKNAKAVILQHTLGYIDEVEAIAKFCQEKKLLLIADLAQAVGAVDQNNQTLGLEADAVILSFGRDKVVDAVAGGAVIFKNLPKKLPAVDQHQPGGNPGNRRPLLSFYPLLMWLIKKTYSFNLGKGLHWLSKKTGLVQTSIKSPHPHYQPYPLNLSPLLLDSWLSLDEQLNHRRKIAYFYLNRLKKNEKVSLLVTASDIKIGTNLRFPILTKTEKNLRSLISFLAKHQVYLADRWYRQPIDSGSINFQTAYQPGSCPQAEKIAKLVLNLPTHQNISLTKAEKIVELINRHIA